MEKEFIPYEQALALKELGFDEECFSYVKHLGYDSSKEKVRVLSEVSRSQIEDMGLPLLKIPTFSQAFRFFREKYNIVHTVYSNASGYIWELHYNQERGGTHICDSGESGDCEMSGMFTVYEKAELECLKKLIEICKNN